MMRREAAKKAALMEEGHRRGTRCLFTIRAFDYFRVENGLNFV
jgi:hypothetical protein